MIDNKKITFEAINHFVEWSQFSRNTKEEINKSLQLYLNQKQYKGLIQLKIDRNVNLSEEKLKFRNRYKSLINDFDLKVIHTPVFDFLTVRSHNCLINAKYFFKKQFKEVTLKELIDVYNPNSYKIYYGWKKVPLVDELLKIKNMGKKTVKEIKRAIEIGYKINLDNFYYEKTISDKGLL
tara:strand:+ start:276 stop:815 length:540 start_codon:yes stop_codon:yes gene_type:complete